MRSSVTAQTNMRYRRGRKLAPIEKIFALRNAYSSIECLILLRIATTVADSLHEKFQLIYYFCVIAIQWIFIFIR